jgi:hypothetical protein
MEIPLLYINEDSPFHELSVLIRADGGDAELRSIWKEFCEDLVSKIEAIETCCDPDTLKITIHSARGMSAQFGFLLLEALLFFWEEHEQDRVAAIPRLLPFALALAKQSIEAMENEMPSLKRS